MMSQSCNKQNAQNSNTNHQVVAIIVPFPMQGHLNEALHLSHFISSYGIQVHYAGFTPYNHQAKLRLHGRTNPDSIHFHDFQLPPFTFSSNPPAQLDQEQVQQMQTHFPGHLQPLFDASLLLRQPVFRLLQQLSSKFTRLVVIHDTLTSSVVQDVKLIPNAETYALHSVSAFTIFSYIWETMTEKPFHLTPHLPQCITPFHDGCFTPEFSNFVAHQHRVLNFEAGRLYNTCRLLEGEYMDLLQNLPLNANKKLFAVGPLNPLLQTRPQMPSGAGGANKCLDWLDKQEVGSVLYVSFGTATTMSEEQIRELATGLEKSGQKFIWVLKNADKLIEVESTRTTPELPQGYEERVRNRGKVVREWAPQLEILAHPSTGGFISHCGWNSCMESISMGVPIAAWPIHSDQPKNSILVTDVLRVGMLVRDWGDRSKLVTSETVENVVVKLMVSNQGKEMRKRAAELGSKVRASVSKDGASRLEVDSFIAHITR